MKKNIIIFGAAFAAFLMLATAFIQPVTARESGINEAIELNDRINNIIDEYEELFITILEDEELQPSYNQLNNCFTNLQNHLSDETESEDIKHLETLSTECTVLTNNVLSIIEEKYEREFSNLNQELALISDELKKYEDTTPLLFNSYLTEQQSNSFLNALESNEIENSIELYEEPIEPYQDMFPLYVGPFFGLGNIKDWYAQSAQSTLYGGQCADGGTYIPQLFDPYASDNDNSPIGPDTSGDLNVYPYGEEIIEPDTDGESQISIGYDLEGNVIYIYIPELGRGFPIINWIGFFIALFGLLLCIFVNFVWFYTDIFFVLLYRIGELLYNFGEFLWALGKN